MKYSLNIDQINSLEWGLNLSEAAVFTYLFTVPSWADPVLIDGKTFYFAARQKTCQDVPLISDKPDTIYRIYKSLSEKGVIEYVKHMGKDCMRIADKAKCWNSEKNPSSIVELGKKSESTRKIFRKNSEKNPTYNNTIDYSTNRLLNNVENEFSTVLIEQDEELTIEVHHVPDYFEEPKKERKKKVAPKKKENPDAAPTAEMWDQYVEAYQRVSKGETPISQTKDFVALSKLYKALHEKAVAKKPDFIPESKTYLWEVFLKQVEKLVQNPGEGWLHDNFTPSIFWSQFNTIMLKINSTQSKKSVVVPLFRQEDYRNVDRRNFKF